MRIVVDLGCASYNIHIVVGPKLFFVNDGRNFPDFAQFFHKMMMVTKIYEYETTKKIIGYCKLIFSATIKSSLNVSFHCYSHR